MSTKTHQKLVLFSPFVLMLSAAMAPIGSVAPDFTIKDQYDHDVQLASQRGKPVLLIYGDDEGSDYISFWTVAVRESPVASSVNVVRIANLRAVPSLLHSYVKRQFMKPSKDGKPNGPVLLDWDASVAKIYGFTDNLTNVYLIDDKGMLRYRASGKGTPDETRKLVEMIASLGQTQ